MQELNGSTAFVTYQNRFLLLHRDDRPDIMFPDHWGLLGGGIEDGETPEEALARELEEEASIDIKNYQLLFVKDFGDKKGYVYHVPLSDEDAQNVHLGDEGQELRFFTFDEMLQLKLTDYVKTYLTEYHDVIHSLVP